MAERDHQVDGSGDQALQHSDLYGIARRELAGEIVVDAQHRPGRQRSAPRSASPGPCHDSSAAPARMASAPRRRRLSAFSRKAIQAMAMGIKVPDADALVAKLKEMGVA